MNPTEQMFVFGFIYNLKQPKLSQKSAEMFSDNVEYSNVYLIWIQIQKSIKKFLKNKKFVHPNKDN